MKKLLVALILMTVFSLNILSQQNYKEGYIINNEGDTISGFINLKTDKLLSNECLFYKEIGDTATSYYPKDIIEFRFVEEGKKYISRTVDIDNIQKTVFLEYLVQGMMNLYYYEDSETQLVYYFFEDEYGKIQAITQQPEILGDYKYIIDTKYQGTLSYMFRDYPGVVPRERRVHFDRKEMINIVKDYHSQVCTTGEECIVFENNYKKRYTELKFTIYGGLQSSSYVTTTWIYYLMGEEWLTKRQKLNLRPSLSPVIGVVLDLSNSRISNSFSALLDVSVSKIDFEEYTTIRNAERVKNYDINAINIGVRIAPKYTYPKGKYRATAQFGLGCNFIRDSGDKKAINHNLTPSFMYALTPSIGLDYNVHGNSFLIARIEYDWSFQQSEARQSQVFDTRKTDVKSWNVKVGYTF